MDPGGAMTSTERTGEGPPEPNADEFLWYTGIDTGGATHHLCVQDAQGVVLGRRAVDHSGAGLAAMITWLQAVAGPSLARMAVGLETPHGGVVAACLAHGAAVFAINPKQLERFRERGSAAGAKDDARDAFVAASALRTDRSAFHRVALEDARLVALRELSRLSAELRGDEGRLSNRLRAQLERYFPRLLTLVPGADEPWLWALLAEAPTPAAAARLTERRLTRLLRDYRIRRLTGAEVQAVLRAPALPVVPGMLEAVSAHVAVLLPQLALVHRQVRACATQLAAALDALAAAGDETQDPAGPGASGPNAGGRGPAPVGRVVQMLRSLPGVGTGVAGVVLAEAAPAVLVGDYHALRTHGGTAPVTKQSGKQRFVVMRRACNPRLRAALFHWARVSIQHDPATHTYYAALRARGHSHARTLRSVADRWLRILSAMVTSGTTYDAARFAGQPTS